MSVKWCALVLGLVGSAAFAQSSVSAGASVQMPYPGAGTTLGTQIEALLAEPNAARDHWGIAVTELDGTPIYGHDEKHFFRPASNTKLFTTAAAMELLKPETTLVTKVSFATPGTDGVTKGNVSLLGVGDANFSDTEFPYRNPAQRKAAAEAAATAGHPITTPDPLRYFDELAAAIVQKGIKRIEGDVVGNDALWTWEPYPEAWGIDDMTWGYGAPVSSLSAEDNELELKVMPGAKAGAPATFAIAPDIGYYDTQMSVITVEKGTPASLDISRAPGSHTLRIYGTIAVGGNYSTELATDDPAEFSALALKHALIAHGIPVTGKAVASHQLLVDAGSFYRESHEPVASSWIQNLPVDENRTFGTDSVSHESPTLSDDIVYTLKVSQNLHAEILLRRLGWTYGKLGREGEISTNAQGVRVVRQFLVNAGLDGDDFLFFDGSGMSSHDLVAPRATAKLLAYAKTRPWFSQWFAGLPVGGEDGTLRARFPEAPLKDHVFAKTGTLGESRALSGYLDCASGKQVIFSIMVDDHSTGTTADRTTMDKIVAAIAAAN